MTRFFRIFIRPSHLFWGEDIIRATRHQNRNGGLNVATAEVTPIELVRRLREREAWYEVFSPETPRSMRVIQLRVEFDEDDAGNFSGRIVERGGCLIETPLDPLLDQALEVATRGT